MQLRETHRIRRILAAVTLSISALGASLALATPALATPSGDLVGATNTSRAGMGLPALRENSQLDAVAQSWAGKLAAAGVLSHNPNLQTQITDWTDLGENVGMGGSIPTLEQAFMTSPEHRANILNTTYTQIGVGSASSIDPGCNCPILWVVVDFRRPESAAIPAGPIVATPPPAAPVAPTPNPTRGSAPVKTVPARPSVPVHPPVNTTHPSALSHPPARTPSVPSAIDPAASVNSVPARTTLAGTASDTEDGSLSTLDSAGPVSSAAALQSQLADDNSIGSTSPSDPVASVLDFASVMATS